MKISRHIIAFVAIALVPPFAQADLLDEDLEPFPTPTLTPEPAPTERPKPTGKGKKEQPKKVSPTKPKTKPGASGVLAPTPSKNRKKSEAEQREPVRWQSDGLRGWREKGEVELVDNVEVTQGSLKLEADKATVFFDEEANDVREVVATGDVKIDKTDPDTGEKIKAYGDKVVFHNKKRTVVLEGNARLWRGADLVRGKKITYEMDTGWIRADRVVGEVHPGEDDL